MRPASMAVANVQANCRVCRSDEFKAHTATDWIDDNSAITEFIVAQTFGLQIGFQLQIIEVLR